MTRCEEFSDLLTVASDDVRAAHSEVLDEWKPDKPPVTTLFAALGDRIAECFDSADVDTNRQMFLLIEDAMASGDQELVTAVATGLVEAMVTKAVRNENLWKRMSPLLGPLTLHHAEAWLAP